MQILSQSALIVLECITRASEQKWHVPTIVMILHFRSTLDHWEAEQPYRDIAKKLAVGNLVAVNHPEWAGAVPQIAMVNFVPENATLDSEVAISWMEQKKPPHKSISMQGFTPSGIADSIKMSGILLYDCQLNPKGKTLKKIHQGRIAKIV